MPDYYKICGHPEYRKRFMRALEFDNPYCDINSAAILSDRLKAGDTAIFNEAHDLSFYVDVQSVDLIARTALVKSTGSTFQAPLTSLEVGGLPIDRFPQYRDQVAMLAEKMKYMVYPKT